MSKKGSWDVRGPWTEGEGEGEGHWVHGQGDWLLEGGMALLASKEEQVGTKCASLWFWHQDAARVIFCFPWEVEGDWSPALGEWVERVLEN